MRERQLIHILLMRKASTGRVSNLPGVTQPGNGRAAGLGYQAFFLHGLAF